jgi:hypothetical protein
MLGLTKRLLYQYGTKDTLYLVTLLFTRQKSGVIVT